MPQSNKPDQSSPFEIVTPGKSKKVGKVGIIVGVTIVVFLTLSIVAGVLLVKQQQNVSEKAAGVDITPTATPTLTPTATPTLTPTPTPTASGNSCNGTCGSNSNCESGLYCYSGFCRNPLCASDATCGCSSASPTATASATPTITPIGTQTTPRPIPVSGTDWPTVLGAGVGVGAIIISLLLAI
jgi:hypothetical protein